MEVLMNVESGFNQYLLLRNDLLRQIVQLLSFFDVRLSGRYLLTKVGFRIEEGHSSQLRSSQWQRLDRVLPNGPEEGRSPSDIMVAREVHFHLVAKFRHNSSMLIRYVCV
ncbi:hypothetical protein CDAR_279651 [Caerostris darwini]|uniref:Maturase K n=1 Tax=Caerostris darwini TaxID=1538125 RepID=A0AAV4RFK1_9ARAC|nr:hypothetical protein CDAR_279651 [Caerostris darwini]